MGDVADILDTAGGPALLSWLRGPRGWQGVLASGLAVATAASATVVLRHSDPASADTRVAVARLAQVYLPDGTNHEAVEGEVLPRGAELHTGDGGGAQLTTAGRRVYLGGLSTLSVQDGVRETLSRGQAMVDARRGANLDLSTPAGTVMVGEGAVARVEEALLTRVAVYDGAVALRPVGRSSSTTVERYHQIKVQPESLPQRMTPLQLKGDTWEKAVAANLVADDEDLNNLADGLALQEGERYLKAAPVAYRTAAIQPPGVARGEQALTALVAQAASVPDALAAVRAARADLGSWGVVAAIVKAPVSGVNAALNQALSPGTEASGPTTVNADPLGNLGGQPTQTRTPGTGSSGHPTASPTGKPTATPSASPDPVDTLVGTVVALVSPPPSAGRVPGPTPTPSPTTVKLQPCLAGAVLC